MGPQVCFDLVLDCDEWLIEIYAWQRDPQCNNAIKLIVFC